MKVSAAVSAVVVASGIVASGFQALPAVDFKSMVVVPLRNGPNQLDLDGDGRMDLVFVAWRDNANAHGFDHITFYRSSPGTPAWNLVPFFGKDDTSIFASFETSQGADCVLRDLRILRPRNKPASPVVVVVAERAFGETFISKEPVTFTVYRSALNADGIPGSPPLYFRAAEVITSKASYCDVGEAFRSELGIPRE